MISEELLPLIEGIDSETSFEELMAIVDIHHIQHHGNPTKVQWENLADVAFLAFRNNKPKALNRAVEIIARICATLASDNSKGVEIFGEENGRACCLICSDAPKDPRVIMYMLGHLKGMLRGYRELCEKHLTPEVQKETREKVSLILTRYGAVKPEEMATA